MQHDNILLSFECTILLEEMVLIIFCEFAKLYSHQYVILPKSFMIKDSNQTHLSLGWVKINQPFYIGFMWTFKPSNSISGRLQITYKGCNPLLISVDQIEIWHAFLKCCLHQLSNCCNKWMILFRGRTLRQSLCSAQISLSCHRSFWVFSSTVQQYFSLLVRYHGVDNKKHQRPFFIGVTFILQIESVR